MKPFFIKAENFTDYSINLNLIKTAVQKTLKSQRKEGKVKIFFVSPQEIKRVNKKYRGENAPTDVLSFGEIDASAAFPNKEEKNLGEILICPEQASRSEAGEKNLERELANLAVHGMLHILGYSHKREKERKEMLRFQKSILEDIL